MRLIWALGGLAVLLLGGITVALAPLDPGIVDLQLAFSARRFGEFIHAWTPDQLALYRAHLPWDGLLLKWLLLVSFGGLVAWARVRAPG